jgi:hypothetical protein
MRLNAPLFLTQEIIPPTSPATMPAVSQASDHN